MLSRVNYLAKEEQKFMKKIEKTRDEAVRMQSIKQSKISDLQHRIVSEHKQQEKLNSRLD